MKKDTTQFKINMPTDVKRWVEAQAEKNLRSQSAEIILALREKMAQETQNAA